MKKLLIVDNDPDLLEAMKYFLEKKGYEALALSHLGKIIIEIENFQPDLIILDIRIGNKDGRKICTELREQCITNDLCIILFSSSPKLLENYMHYGADGILEKPFDLNTLLSKIESVLKICHAKIKINQNINL